MRILCAGLTVIDIMACPISPEILTADSTVADYIRPGAGGDAMNVAIGLSKLGQSAAIAGRVGNEVFGSYIRQYAASFGVDVSGIKVSGDGRTAATLVLIRPDGERSFVYSGGESDRFSGADIDDDMLDRADLLYVGSAFGLPALLLDEGFKRLLSRAKKKGCLTAMDVTGTPRAEQFPQIAAAFDYLDYFLPSLTEATQLSGEESFEKAADFFRFYGCGTVVIKLGEQGCYVRADGTSFRLPAFKSNQIDATGAGDAFVAGFLSGVAQRLPLTECARRGNAAGHFCVEAIGSNAGSPTIDQLEAFLHNVSAR